MRELIRCQLSYLDPLFATCGARDLLILPYLHRLNTKQAHLLLSQPKASEIIIRNPNFRDMIDSLLSAIFQPSPSQNTTSTPPGNACPALLCFTLLTPSSLPPPHSSILPSPCTLLRPHMYNKPRLSLASRSPICDSANAEYAEHGPSLCQSRERKMIKRCKRCFFLWSQTQSTRLRASQTDSSEPFHCAGDPPKSP
jgi:hypothetical protein